MQRKKRKTTKKRPTKNSVFVIIALLIIALFVISATAFKITEVFLSYTNNDFPKLEIFLSEAPIEQINSNNKNIKYPGNTIAITTDKEPAIYNDVEIKGRGNTTWEKDKKPYQIKFKNKESVFGIEEDKKWVVLANALDPSSLRTDTAFYIEKLLNENFPLKGHFVELYADNNYYGLYYISKKVEITKNRVDLSDPYGILVELDNIYNETEGCNYDNDEEDCFIVKDLVNTSMEQAALKGFLDNFNSLKTAIDKKQFTKIEKLIDVDSFAKYYLLNEFTANPDAYSTSFFMYKNGENDKIHAGPGWDFDLALGNKEWVTNGVDEKVFHSPYETMALRKYPKAPYNTVVSTVIYKLLDIPEFEARVKEIYQETLSGKKEEVLDYIENQAEYIRPAALRDQERWKLKTSFDEEVDYLIDWVFKRFDHFEKTYGTNSSPIDTSIILNQDQESQRPSKE